MNMPRQRAYSDDDLLEKSLWQFWLHGYHATSMDDLVKTTSVSRHGIYSRYGGKKKLFLACFDHYQKTVVSPAFSSVEQPGADLQCVADYFEFQIASGEDAGLPGPGCFVANSATEVAPGDGLTMEKVRHHNARLRGGFAGAVRNQLSSVASLTDTDVSELAEVCVIFTNGLWSMSRCVGDAAVLRAAVTRFLASVSESFR